MSDYTTPDRDARPDPREPAPGPAPGGDTAAAPSGDDLRASHAEREAALDILATHYADGRLDGTEFDQRADAALAARTRNQLRTLFIDLPGPGPVPDTRRSTDLAPASVPAAARARSRQAAVPGSPPLALVPVLVALAVIAALHGIPPFPLIALLFVLGRRRRWNREARPWM